MQGPPFYAHVHKKGLEKNPTSPPKLPQDQLHPHVKKMYSSKVQHPKSIDESPLLNKAGKKFIQERMEVFRFLARAVYWTLLTPLSAIASDQAGSTENTMQKCLQFLDWVTSQEGSILTYHVSNMTLPIHSNASYLSKPKACSQASRHMFIAGVEKIPLNNGAVLNISQII
jgi:hypothetical protein